MNNATSSSSIQNVGYIGMGIMGSAMAANLLKAGFRVTVWNRTKSKAQPLLDQGAAWADSPADMAAAGPDVICTNVTDTADVEHVLFGSDGIASKAKKGLIVIDNSTISPVATQDFARRLADIGVTLLDAPVSGGDVGARNGTLAIMVGGPKEAFDKCLPLFQAVGKAITHLGDSGAGQVCKACNQISVVGNLLATCEALAMAKQCGLDVEKMIQVVGGGAGGSWQLTNLGPRIARGDHDPGFMVDLVLKDLNIVAQTAREKKLPLTVTALAETYFRAVQADGGGRLGTQAVAKVLEKLGAFKFDQ